MTLKTQKISKIKELFDFDEKAAGAVASLASGANIPSPRSARLLHVSQASSKKHSPPRLYPESLSSAQKTSARKTACHVIGTDEAGRGPGAGPVFAAAVCFKMGDDVVESSAAAESGNESGSTTALATQRQKLFEALSLLNDSKQISEKNRESLYETIVNLPESVCAYHIEAGSVEQIEKINILNTSLSCMHLACENVAVKLNKGKALGAAPFTILVDGNKKIKQANGKVWAASQTTVVKGDSKSAAIAAASILAKVSRDRFMCALAKEFPHYGWERNKGYLTAEHVEAIKKHGVTCWHRAKFLRKILGENEAVKPSAEIAKDQLSLF